MLRMVILAESRMALQMSISMIDLFVSINFTSSKLVQI